MCRFSTMLKMIFRFLSVLFAFLLFFFFLPSLLCSFLPSSLAFFLIGSSLCVARRGKGILMWLLCCPPKSKTVFTVYYVTVSTRHKGLHTSYILSHLSNFSTASLMALRIVDIQSHLLNWNGTKWKPLAFLRVRGWEWIWEGRHEIVYGLRSGDNPNSSYKVSGGKWYSLKSLNSY